MSEPRLEEFDAVVIGTSMRGLVTAYVLDMLGYRAVLIERGRSLAGVDGSFATPSGARFDHGMHVLDYMRSDVATRLFTRVLGGRVRRTTLQRGVVLRGHIMPYSPKPSEMPQELRALLPGDELADDIGDARPTRERLGRCYGEKFAAFVFEEVLPSYASEARHLEFGVDESELLANVYPWVFPRASRQKIDSDESRAFHDLLRDGVAQDVLYPEEGGFGGFAQGFIDSFDKERIDVIQGASDLSLDIEPGTHTVRSVTAGGRRFVAPHYFWGASWNMLAELLDLPRQHTATDRVVLGSFVLDRPALTDYHELLVADPAFMINRVSFPARFSGSNDPLMQIEYAYPVADPPDLDDAGFRERWLADLGKLGLLDAGHRVEEYDFRGFELHYNGYGMEGERLREADPSLIREDSNIRPVVPSLANLNLNAHVPRSIEYVSRVLADLPPRA
jgi:protoporphyrinogen oxidase